MPDDTERQRRDQQTDRPQDGPDAGGSSQDQPAVGEVSDDAGERRGPRPGPPGDTNERADARATVVEPDGAPVRPPDEEEA